MDQETILNELFRIFKEYHEEYNYPHDEIIKDMKDKIENIFNIKIY